MAKSLVKKLYLKYHLYYLNIKKGTSMKDHIDEFNIANTDLRNISVLIANEDQALILLCSLPPSYENFIDIMLHDKEFLLLSYIKMPCNLKS